MAKAKQAPVDDCGEKYRAIQQAKADLLAATTDEELGRMYRQRFEASTFLTDRGLY